MKNQTGKYFKYAIGEIILVVIGILIALQINTWNENYKDKKQLSTYYERLITDLKNDLTEMEQHENYFSSSLAPLHQEIKNIQSTQYNTDSLYKNVGAWMRYTRDFKPNKSTFEDLLSTGNLNLIPNKNLRTLLLDLYNVKYPNLIFLLNRGNDMTTKMRLDAFIPNLSYLDIFKNDRPHLDDPEFSIDRPVRGHDWLAQKNSEKFIEFENTLVLNYEIFYGNLSRFNKIRPDIQNLLNLINKELVKN
jgi:hypothetical protein